MSRAQSPSNEQFDLRSGARRSALLMGGLAVVVVAALAIAMVKYGGSGGEDTQVDAAPTVDAGPDHGRHTTKIKILRIELERAPCDRRKAKKLAKTLNQAGDYRGTIRFVDSFHQRCDTYSRLWWNVSHAHQQLGEYAESAEVITRLIEGRPRDSDFWWWRAEDHARLGEIDRADADYRQSLATKPNKFAARRYLPLMGETTPCEVAWAVQYMLEQRPDHVFQWMRDTASDRYVAGRCDSKKGTGKAELAIVAGEPVIRTAATLNEAEGQFLVQEKTAFTVLTRAFAERARLSITGVDVPVYAGGQFLTGKRAIVGDMAVGKAKASKVVAVVVDQLPGDIDGMVGLSFLWRFRTEKTDAHLLIQAR